MSLIEQWVQRILLLLALMLIPYIGYMIAQLTWRAIYPDKMLVFHSRQIEPAALTKNGLSSPDKSQLVNIGEMTRWKLFGAKHSEPKTANKINPASVHAPDTTLKLELLGVFLSENERISTAIIGEAGGRVEPEVYRIGDRVSGGTTLEQVFENRVILNRNGRMEMLRFEDQVKNGLMVLPNAEKTNYEEEPNPIGYEVPEELASQTGYLITDMAPSYILGYLKAEVGDRILKINGVAIGSQAEGQSLMSEVIAQGSTVAIEVEGRTGRFIVDMDMSLFQSENR